MNFFYSLLVLVAYSASSGAKKCDALGVCSNVESGAYIDENGNTICPWGMHMVTPPVSSDAYLVSTARYGETGPTTYTPGKMMDIHITVLNAKMKYLGILLYAVQFDNVYGLGDEGCRNSTDASCNGLGEQKLGQWEATDPQFQVSCSGQAMTHTNAKVKNFHHVFRWRAPGAGSGPVAFRVIIKQGSTNMGHFYWPMQKDLVLEEGHTQDSMTEWLAGPIGLTCGEICSQNNRMCDHGFKSGSLDLYDAVQTTQSCQKPLLSTCTSGAPTRDADGYCWFENADVPTCTSQPANICTAVEVSGGEERLCPCSPDDSNGWNPSTEAPTPDPTAVPTHEPTPAPSHVPTTAEPTHNPTFWYEPRWSYEYGTATDPSPILCTRDGNNRIRQIKGTTFGACQDGCANDGLCWFFNFNWKGRCEHYKHCDSTRTDKLGVTMKKTVLTTLEPTSTPTTADPTYAPTHDPTSVPTTADPTPAPTQDPTPSPTFAPTFAPTASTDEPTPSPTQMPTPWTAPRWVYKKGSETHVEPFRCRRGSNRVRRISNVPEEECRTACHDEAACQFYWHSIQNLCELYRNCGEAELRSSRNGVIVEKVFLTSQPVDPSGRRNLGFSWVEVFGGSSGKPATETCSSAGVIAKVNVMPTSARKLCQMACSEQSNCMFFRVNESLTSCGLYERCDVIHGAGEGITVEKKFI